MVFLGELYLDWGTDQNLWDYSYEQTEGEAFIKSATKIYSTLTKGGGGREIGKINSQKDRAG